MAAPPQLSELATTLASSARDLQPIANGLQDPQLQAMASKIIAKTTAFLCATNHERPYELQPWTIQIGDDLEDLKGIRDQIERHQTPPPQQRQSLRIVVDEMEEELARLQVITAAGDTLPMNESELLRLIIALVIYLITLVVVSLFNTKGALVALCLFGGIFFSLAAFYAGSSMLKRRQTWSELYNANRANTVCTSLLIFGGLTLLYSLVWFPKTREPEVKTKYVPMEGMTFPKVAILQKTDWPAQANLSGTKNTPDCYLGQFEKGAVPCKEETATTDPFRCNCRDLWGDTIEDFSWGGSPYSMWNFRPGPQKLVTTSPTFMMLLQVFFTYDPSASNASEGVSASPGLFLTIYDPDKSLQEALENGVATLTDINALGATSVQLDNSERHLINGKSFQTYGLSITSIPSTELVCNASRNAQPKMACTTSVYLRAQNFIKTVMIEQHEWEWLDVMLAAGATVSFFQLISWILSDLCRSS